MKKILVSILVVFVLSLGACSLFQKEEVDQSKTLAPLLILGLLNSGGSSDCTGSSGMVICIPKGLAQ